MAAVVLGKQLHAPCRDQKEVRPGRTVHRAQRSRFGGVECRRLHEALSLSHTLPLRTWISLGREMAVSRRRVKSSGATSTRSVYSLLGEKAASISKISPGAVRGRWPAM